MPKNSDVPAETGRSNPRHTSLQFQLPALGTVLQGGGVQLTQIDDLFMIGMVTDHKGFREIAGDIQHNAFGVRGGEIIPRPLAGGTLIKVKNTDYIAFFYKSV
jgi:hypothetical protein